MNYKIIKTLIVLEHIHILISNTWFCLQCLNEEQYIKLELIWNLQCDIAVHIFSFKHRASKFSRISREFCSAVGTGKNNISYKKKAMHHLDRQALLLYWNWLQESLHYRSAVIGQSCDICFHWETVKTFFSFIFLGGTSKRDY